MWNLETNIYLEILTRYLFGNLELSIYLESTPSVYLESVINYSIGIRNQRFIWNLEPSIYLESGTKDLFGI